MGCCRADGKSEPERGLCSAHGIDRCVVGDGQVRYHFGVHAAVWRAIRKLGCHEPGETPQVLVPIGGQPQDFVTEPPDVKERLREGRRPTKERLETCHKVGIDLVRGDEGKKHGHMGWHSPASHRVQLTTDVGNGIIDLRHLDHEGRASHAQVSSLRRGHCDTRTK